MKKLSALLVALVMLFTFAACGGESQNISSLANADATTQSQTEGNNEMAESQQQDEPEADNNEQVGETDDEPIAQSKPAQSNKPTASTKPSANSKPTSSSKPASTNKPSASSKPTANTSSKPSSSSSKPASNSKPAQTASKFTTINVPALAQKTHSIASIPQSSKTMTAANIKTITGSMTYEDQEKTYSYTPARDGRYRFDFANVKSGITFMMYIRDSLGEIVKQTYSGYGNGDGLTTDLEGGKKYTIEIQQYRSTGSYTLNIGEQTATVDISSYTSVADSTKFTDQQNYYNFTPERDGYYRFDFTNVKSGVTFMMYIRDSLGEIVKQTYSGYGNGDGLTAYLEGGKKHTIEIRQYRNTGNYTLNIGKQKATVDISSYSVIKDSIEYTDQVNYYTFKAAEDGRYRFDLANVKSDISFDLYLYDSLDEIVAQTYSDIGNGDGLTVKELKKGETYTLAIHQSDNSGSYTLKFGKQKATTDIYTNCIVSDKIEHIDQRNVYKFVAKKAGTHVFTVTGLESGNKVELRAFDELEEMVANDDNCENKDSIMLKNLKVGDTYEIQVRYNNALSSYKLTVEV